MKTINPIGYGINGKHYFTLVVSKEYKTVFALIDILSQRSEERYLMDRIVDLTNLNINKRFGFYHCGSSINFEALPVKYRKYKFVETLEAFKLTENIELI